MEQINDKPGVSPAALQQLSRALDGLTDAIRELSWILLDRWEWVPVEDRKNQPTSLRSATE